MSQHFACPSCTAPLEYDGAGTTVRCTYCDTTVIVPEAIRTAQMSDRARSFQITINAAGSDVVTISSEDGASTDPNHILAEIQRMARNGESIAAIKLYRETFGTNLDTARRAVAALARNETLPGAPMPFRRVRKSSTPAATGSTASGVAWGCVGWLVLMVILASIGGAIYAFTVSTRSMTSTISSVTTTVRESVSDFAPGTSTAVQELVGGWAAEVNRFGSKGIGPGMFTDARAIAAGWNDRIYVGDYDTGRVQVFDKDGTFRTTWSFPKDSYVGQFAASNEGVLYAPVHTKMHMYAADTGHLLNEQQASENSWLQAGTIESALAPGLGALWFEDSVAMAPDGGIVTVIDGSIVRFDKSGVPVLTIADAIESVSDRPETTTIVAIDGLGTIYALGESQDVVYKFGSDGRYLSRFGGAALGGDSDGQGVLRAASALAVDNQGRIYVGDSDGIEVFDSEGRSLALIDTPSYPFGLAFDAAGRLFVALRDNVVEYQILK